MSILYASRFISYYWISSIQNSNDLTKIILKIMFQLSRDVPYRKLYEFFLPREQEEIVGSRPLDCISLVVTER